MSNDPRADLIYAILAMDVYNRPFENGRGTGIAGLDASGKIGDFDLQEATDQ